MTSDMGTNFTNTECFHFSKSNFNIVFWMKIGMEIMAVIASSVAIMLVVFLKAYKRFVHRLAFYFSITALFTSISCVLEILPVREVHSRAVVMNKILCKASGFLDEYFVWVILILMCWVSLHLFILAVFKRSYTTAKYEIGGVLASLTIPLLISIVPFIPFKNGPLYGLSGAWCWIKLTNETCHQYRDGMIEQFTLWYGPVIFFVTLNFLAMLVVVCVLCKGATGSQLQDKYKEALKETMPLLFYPIIYSIVYGIAFANRILYAVTKKTNVPLWVAHATAEPCLSLLIPLAFILHPYTLKKLNCFLLIEERRHCSQHSHTHFVVSGHNSCNAEEHFRLPWILERQNVKSDPVSHAKEVFYCLS